MVQPVKPQTVSAADTLRGTWTVRVTLMTVLGTYGSHLSVQIPSRLFHLWAFLQPPDLYNDPIYTCTATVIDPDETPVLSYQWALEGNPVGSNVKDLDLNGTGAMPDDLPLHRHRNRQRLATGVGSTSTLDNRAPVLSNLVIDPPLRDHINGADC